MIRSALPRKRVAATICCLAFTEWILFELIRVPYRPPQDMLTFLGTEKYAVMVLMLGMAVLGFALILSWAIRSFWTKEDVIVLAVLATILIGLGLLVVFQPGWSVTPLHLLLH